MNSACIIALTASPAGEYGYLEYMVKSLAPFAGRVVVAVSVGKEMLPFDGSCDVCPVAEGSSVLEKWRAGIELLIRNGGWPERLVLMDDSLYGPIGSGSFESMFSAMQGRECDFWGLTMFLAEDGTPEFILPHFLVFNLNDGLKDALPRLLPHVARKGRELTAELEECGFQGAVFCDAGEWGNFVHNPLSQAAWRLVEEKGCPFLSRSLFYRSHDETINYHRGYDAPGILKKLKDSSLFPVDLIWDDLLGNRNQFDVKNALALNFVLPAAGRISGVGSELKTALYLHLYYEDLFDVNLDYAELMPPGADVYITVSSEDSKSELEKKGAERGMRNLTVSLVPARGRSESAFIMGARETFRQYDLICVAHDKKTGHIKPAIVGMEFGYHCLDCLLESRPYVENIISTFAANPRMGMLMPPNPAHTCYAEFVWANEWAGNYKLVCELVGRLGVNVPMSHEKPAVIPFGGMFWCRPEAMAALMDYPWTYEDFPEEPIKDNATLLHAIERSYSLFVQQAGYYPAWVLSDHYASVYIGNLSHLYRETFFEVPLPSIPEESRPRKSKKRRWLFFRR